MASSGPINGTAFQVWIGTNFIAYATNCSISMSHNPRITTNSTSGAYATRMAGTIDWEISVDSLVSMDGLGTKFHELWTSYLDTRTIFQIRYKTEVSGDKYFDGLAIMTGLSMDAAMEETSTMNCTFAGSGELILPQVW